MARVNRRAATRRGSARDEQEAEAGSPAPALRVGDGVVRVGTCSWTDRTLVRDTGWYPRTSMSAAERLAFYARHFPVVEADSTYYRPPSRELTRSWAERTPGGFVFDVKAYSLLTHHPTRPETLWPDVRESVRSEDLLAKPRVYAEHLTPDALEEAWLRFADALGPLARAGRLGGVLVQLPAWFVPKRANREELARLPERLPGLRVSVELRAPGWFATDDDAERTLALLRDHGLVHVVVDAPAVSRLRTVVAATRDDLAVVRFHGRADETWNLRGATAAERFRYLYRDEELAAWRAPLRELAGEAREVHALLNNCYRDFGVRNAADLVRLLRDDGAVDAGAVDAGAAPQPAAPAPDAAEDEERR